MVCSNMPKPCGFSFRLYFAGPIPVELGQLVNLTVLALGENRLTGAVICPLLHASSYFCLILLIVPPPPKPGRVPNELAKLTNLTALYLNSNKDLQVPEGAPVHSILSLGMFYGIREQVAAFQVCLK